MTLHDRRCPPVDLTTCDLEPIHVIGRIQSFGWLLSFSSDWIINHASLNCSDLFGCDARELIGVPATRFLAPSALHDLRTRLQILGGRQRGGAGVRSGPAG
ncbi:hypothetical protein ACFSTD_06585 [Novosphingobium colocasiae]